MANDLKRTPLYEEHVKLEARLVPFGGFEMPVQYPPGISAEHRAVREVAGLFDVSHMGEFCVRGSDAVAFVDHLVTNKVTRLEPGQAQYSMMCNEDGGILDDLVLYRFEDRVRLVVNAANIDKDLAWIEERLRAEGTWDVQLSNESDGIALLALQGPASEKILEELTDLPLSSIGFYRFDGGLVADQPCVVSRTGYTGEDGFELYCDADAAPDLWNRVLAGGREHGLIPAGLGARDTLRLEVGYALYGNDIDEGTTPLEAGLGWTVKLDKGPFVGREALIRQKEEGPERKLVGFVLRERGFPRAGYEVHHEGKKVGEVRSGTVGPSVGTGIGTTYVPVDLAKPGTQLAVVIRDRAVPAEVTKMPFYKEGSLKR